MQNLAIQKKRYLFHHCIPESKKEKEFHNESPNYQKQSKKGGSKKKLQKDCILSAQKEVVTEKKTE